MKLQEFISRSCQVGITAVLTLPVYAQSNLEAKAEQADGLTLGEKICLGATMGLCALVVGTCIYKLAKLNRRSSRYSGSCDSSSFFTYFGGGSDWGDSGGGCGGDGGGGGGD
ncbi:MAG: hypothetical protein AABY00_00640 [Nanoarchaeota archaeon]